MTRMSTGLDRAFTRRAFSVYVASALALGSAACTVPLPATAPAGPANTTQVTRTTSDSPAPAAPTATGAGQADALRPVPASTPTPAPSPVQDRLRPADPTPPARPTDGSQPSRPTSTAVARVNGQTQIDALWFSRGPEGVGGGMSRVVVRVERQATTDGDLRVGFYETEVGASGPMWRSAGWMAVTMSGLLLGIDPSDLRFTFDVSGRIDGPSAGTLMTIGTMATVLGHQVRSDATMTGTINPDGTVGPVGGIPQKIDGAAKAGKKLILIPAGQRQSQDMATNRSVDVVDRGRRLGVEVKEVSDVYEAYELLTGSALPKPVGMKEVRPALPGQSFERTRAKAKEWYTRYWQLQGQYQALPAQGKSQFTEQLMTNAAKAGDKAEHYYGQGLLSGAYNRAFTATLQASVGYHSARVMEAIGRGGPAAGMTYLQAMRSVRLKAESFVERLGTQPATTLSDVVAIADAYGNINTATGLIEMAEGLLQGEAKTQDEAVGRLVQATLLFALADHLVELAKDSLDVGLGAGKAPAPTGEVVERLAEQFRRAAEANLNYFETVEINKIAEAQGAHPNVIKSRFGQFDVVYTFARSSLSGLGKLREAAPNRTQAAYATLGGALQSYVLSSVLVAKYYSLDVTFDQQGQLTGVRHERAMVNMLDFAEKRARESIGLGMALGAEPVQPVVAYEGAKIDREGDLSDKFNALGGFWAAALQEQVIGVLSGGAALVK